MKKVIVLILTGVVAGGISFVISYTFGSIAGKMSVRRYRRDVEKIHEEFMKKAKEVIPRGYWIEKDGDLICSHCESEFSGDICRVNKALEGRPLFCPSCGAFMSEWAIEEDEE